MARRSHLRRRANHDITDIHVGRLLHREGKAYLTIGIGCTGGKHRSVAIAEAVAAMLDKLDIDVSVRHRDIPVAAV